MSERLITLLAVAALAACGGAEETGGFPALEGHWIVEGLSCDGSGRTRMIEVGGPEEGHEARYVRGDECVSAGQGFWDQAPAEEGDALGLLLGAEERSQATVERVDANGLDLHIAGGATARMRRVSPERNPPSIGPRGVNLGGTWWMEGYPCDQERVPQLVFALHSGSVLSLRKVIGDECLGDGLRFFDGALVEDRIDGESELIDWDPFTWDGDDQPIPVPTNGQVRTEEHFTLNVLGQVRFWRVLSEPR